MSGFVGTFQIFFQFNMGWSPKLIISAGDGVHRAFRIKSLLDGGFIVYENTSSLIPHIKIFFTL
jgi:hypothetical protein